MIEIYVDGSTVTNPGPGAWAAVIVAGGREVTITGYEPNTTNSRVELMAAIEGLRFFKACREITVYSDSQYVVNMFAKGWIDKWAANDYKKTVPGSGALKDVKNRDLVKAIDAQNMKHHVSWLWVRGHSGNHYNEMAHQAAYDAAQAGYKQDKTLKDAVTQALKEEREKCSLGARSSKLGPSESKSRRRGISREKTTSAPSENKDNETVTSEGYTVSAFKTTIASSQSKAEYAQSVEKKLEPERLQSITTNTQGEYGESCALPATPPSEHSNTTPMLSERPQDTSKNQNTGLKQSPTASPGEKSSQNTSQNSRGPVSNVVPLRPESFTETTNGGSEGVDTPETLDGLSEELMNLPPLPPLEPMPDPPMPSYSRGWAVYERSSQYVLGKLHYLPVSPSEYPNGGREVCIAVAQKMNKTDSPIILPFGGRGKYVALPWRPSDVGRILTEEEDREIMAYMKDDGKVVSLGAR